MKKFDIKSLVAGIIIGTIGATTVFAASGIKSAILSNAKVTLDGAAVPLNKSLVAVTKDNEKDASLYMPVRELLEYLGYTVNWDSTRNTVILDSSNKSNSNNSITATEPIILNKKQYTYLTELKVGQSKSERTMFKIDSLSAFLYLQIEDYSELVGIKVYYGNTDKLAFGSLGSTFVEGGISGFPIDCGVGTYSVELISSEKNNNNRVTLYGVATDKITDYKNIILPNDEPVSKKTEEQLQIQIINVDVKSIEAKGFIELGEYNLSAGDNIHFNVSATGKGLSIGFIKSTENVKTANIKYFAQTVSGENASIKNNNVTVPPEVAGYYKLYIQSVGENKLTSIKGTVEIIQSYVKAEKVETKKQDVQSENNAMSFGYKTIDVDILNVDKALTTTAKTSLGDKYYYAFGPYSTPSNTDKVIIDIKNGVNGDLFIATSPNKEMTDGVTNTYSTGSTYKGSIGIFDNNTGNYYIIIGAKDFKNLKGTIQIPISK